MTTKNISHPNKIYFPKNNITKEALIEYYAKVSDYFLPHTKSRPITIERYPNGIDESGFIQQNVKKDEPHITVKQKSGDDTHHPKINSKEDLHYYANLGTITFHHYLSTEDAINKPDIMMFDLDPSQKNLKALHTIAKAIKTVLEDKGLTSFIMTSGSKGYHIIIPIKPEHDFDYVRDYAKGIAETVIERHPDLATIEMQKDNREGKIFTDYLRNAFGQTTVVPYAVRTKKDAPVATPLTWDELTSSMHPQKYTIENIFKRLGKKEDPFKHLYKKRQSLS
ncbi:MAG: non-homologous end-joining DNA ligase [Bacillota bacterium]